MESRLSEVVSGTGLPLPFLICNPRAASPKSSQSSPATSPPTEAIPLSETSCAAARTHALCLVKTKSAFEINNIRKRDVTMCMPSRLPKQQFAIDRIGTTVQPASGPAFSEVIRPGHSGCHGTSRSQRECAGTPQSSVLHRGFSTAREASARLSRHQHSTEMMFSAFRLSPIGTERWHSMRMCLDYGVHFPSRSVEELSTMSVDDWQLGKIGRRVVGDAEDKEGSVVARRDTLAAVMVCGSHNLVRDVAGGVFRRNTR
jgi:hypothetical protein